MRTVLIIDDDAVFRTALAKALQADGWNLIEAGDGEAGLALARQHRPAAIVCDLLMPRCNGFEVCRSIRSQPDLFSHTRVIITSNSNYPADRRSAVELGADDYFVKPVRPKELSQKLAAMFSDPASPGDDGNPLQHDRDKSDTLVRFWGVRGSIATPGSSTIRYGGNTSCVEVRSTGEIVILDAGTGIRPLGLSLVREFKEDPMRLTVLITHTHWDHIQGFPFFVPAYNPRNRVRVLGFDGARKGLESTLSSQMESPYFPISMQQMPGNISIQELRDMSFVVGPLKVQATFMNHPGVCVGYRLFTPAGSVAYLPDNELFQRLKSHPDEENKSTDEETKEFAQHQDRKLVSFIQDADVLIIDSQYDADEYPSHVGWGHSCVDDTAALAIAGSVKRLFLFHHDPGHDDAHIDGMVERARTIARDAGSTMQVDAAREGLELLLKANPTGSG